MKKIFKYQLVVTDEQLVTMPKDAEILAVGNQDEKLCMWAIVNPDAETEKRKIAIRGTGHELGSIAIANSGCCKKTGIGAKFIGTVLMVGGGLVFHVFDMGVE